MTEIYCADETSCTEKLRCNRYRFQTRLYFGNLGQIHRKYLIVNIFEQLKVSYDANSTLGVDF